MQNIVDIGSLITQGKILKTADIDPNNDYAILQKWRAGNRKRGAGIEAYESFAIPLSELLGGGSAYFGDGTTITLGPGNIFSFTSMNISQFTNDSGYLTAAAVVNTAWALNGNTVGTLKSLGTIDNFALPIIINNVERARFDTTGNLGIGIASPAAKLHVNGTTRIEDAIYIQNDGYLTFSAGTNVSLMTLAGRYLSLRSVDQHVEVMTNGLERMRINAAGEVLINTLTPLPNFSRLSVDGNIGTTGSLNTFTAGGDPYGVLRFNNVAGTTQYFAAGYDANGVFLQSYGNNLILNPLGNNVGINVINPTSKLQIAANAGFQNGIDATSDGGYAMIGAATTGVGVRGTNGSGYGIGVDGFSTNNVGVRGQSTNGLGGYFSAPISLIAKGIDATASNWALQAKDSADNPILYARNDGKILMGTGSLIYKLNVYGSTLTQGWWSRGINRITYGNNEIQPGDARPNIEWDNSVDGQVFITGIKNDDTWGIFCKGASDYGFEINRTTRNIGMSISPASDIKLKVRGASATSADYAGVFETSTGATLFSVRNDGRMSAPLLQTGNAGLAAGDLYVDTAANILANGDRVVGRKV